MLTGRKLRVIGIVVGCLVLTASGVWNSYGDFGKAQGGGIRSHQIISQWEGIV